MANSYKIDLDTEPGSYLNGHPTTAKELRRAQKGGTNPMARKKEPVKKPKPMVKGK